MVNCAIVGCYNDSRKSTNVTYYPLPKDKLMKKAWLHKISRDKTNLPKECNTRVCSVHFEEESFKRDLEVGMT